jgi:hypothetical protein
LQGGGHRFDPGILHQIRSLNDSSNNYKFQDDVLDARSLTTEYEDSTFAGNRWSSAEGHTVDALALAGDEGRSKLRKASGSRLQALIRGFPNGETYDR